MAADFFLGLMFSGKWIGFNFGSLHHTALFLLISAGGLQFQPMMESGTTFAQHGRTLLDHGSCIKMARLELLVKV